MLIIPMFVSLCFLPPVPVLVTWLVFALMLLPGDLFVMRCFPGLRSDPVERVTAGIVTGYLISTAFGVAIRAIDGPDLVFLLIAIVAVPLTLRFIFRRVAFPVSDQSAPSATVRWSHLVLAVLILILLAIPYSRVGESTEMGIAYRDFFSGDFLKHTGITTSLTNADIPPENPYFKGETLHYYWMYYLIPAMIMRQLGPDTCEPVLITMNMLFAGLFLWFWFGLCRRLAPGKTGAFMAGVLPFFLYSSEGFAVLLDVLKKGKPWFRFTDYNIDGYSRWILGHPEIDGVYRLLLYNMQHILPTILVLLALRLWCIPGGGSRRSSIGLGILAALTIGHSGFVGSFLVFWMGLSTVLTNQAGGSTLRERALRACAIGVPPAVAIVVYGLYFDMTGGGNPLTATLVPAFRTSPLLFIALNFGTAMLAVVGIPFWKKAPAPIWLLFVISTAILIGVIVPEWPSDVAVKVGYSTALSGALLTGMIPSWLKSRLLRYIFIAVFVICGIFCMPTLVFEILNFRDIANRNSTSYIPQEEWDAYLWMRDTLPEDAIVQRGLKTDIRDAPFSPIPNFAQRRTVVGDRMHARIFLVPDAVYQPRRQEVEYIFRFKDAGPGKAVTFPETNPHHESPGYRPVFHGPPAPSAGRRGP